MDYGSFNHCDYHIGSCWIIPDHTGSYWIILNSGSWHIRSYQIMSYWIIDYVDHIDYQRPYRS